MSDLTSRLSLCNVPQWVREVRRVKPHIPLVVVGSKANGPGSFSVSQEQIALLCGESLPYVKISTMAWWNDRVAVFETFMRWLLEDESVRLEDGRMACCFIPEINMTPEQIARLEAENAAAAAAVPLPDEDEDL